MGERTDELGMTVACESDRPRDEWRHEASDQAWLVPPEHRPTCPLDQKPCTSWTCLVDVCVDTKKERELAGRAHAPVARTPAFCQSAWQGPSDETCTDDLLVISCVNRRGHAGHHVGWYKDDDEYVYWRTGTSDLERTDGSIKQAQFAGANKEGCE